MAAGGRRRARSLPRPGAAPPARVRRRTTAAGPPSGAGRVRETPCPRTRRPRDRQWTVPLGGGIGKIFHLGKLPVNTQIQACYNVAKPDFGPNWQIRAQMQLMFPK